MGFGFENLDVYKRAISLASQVYGVTKKFPQNEIYGIISQMRRAAVSVSANIAEGSGRYHKKDFIQFLRIARSSVYECMPLIEISFKENYLTKTDYEALQKACNELAKMINGLIKSLENNISVN